jgi:hypothetical protein
MADLLQQQASLTHVAMLTDVMSLRSSRLH